MFARIATCLVLVFAHGVLSQDRAVTPLDDTQNVDTLPTVLSTSTETPSTDMPNSATLVAEVDEQSSTGEGHPHQMTVVDRVEVGLFAMGEHRRNRRLGSVSATKVIQGPSGMAPYHCLAECLREESAGCVAFNLNRAEGICELLPVHVCNHSGLRLDNSPGFDYFDVYDRPSIEVDGPMHNTLYCVKRGFCNPECEQYAYMPLLDEPCSEDFECQGRAGPNAVCRRPPGLCKCRQGYYIESNNDDKTKTCERLEAEGFRVFPNLKTEGKQGLYFKLVLINKNFEQASNHCIEAEGGYLAMAEDGDTNRFLREYMRKNKVRSAYLGLTDQTQEGNWIWTHTGQKLKTSQFWKSGAPDNFNDIEHCAIITNEIDFGWDDVPCDKATRFFCQRPETN